RRPAVARTHLLDARLARRLDLDEALGGGTDHPRLFRAFALPGARAERTGARRGGGRSSRHRGAAAEDRRHRRRCGGRRRVGRRQWGHRLRRHHRAASPAPRHRTGSSLPAAGLGPSWRKPAARRGRGQPYDRGARRTADRHRHRCGRRALLPVAAAAQARPARHVMKPMISARAISVSIGRNRILNDVSIEAPPGAVTAVIGPNGSGKTTLLKALSGELAYDGDVTINGRSLAGLKPWQAAAMRAVLPQAATLF